MKNNFKTFIKIIIFFASWIILSVAIPISENFSDVWWRFIAEFTSFLSIVLLSYVFNRIEKRHLTIIHFEKPAKQSIYGILLGFTWFFVPFLILNGLGYLEVTEKNHIDLLCVWVISILINTIMQELMARGYIYQLSKNQYNTKVATIITTLLFTFMHGGAFEAGPVAVINVITMSLLMTIILEYSKSLLIPMIMHFIWNVMGGIFFGTVALAEDYPHLYNIRISGNPIMSGGLFKMEGSIIVFIMNVILIGVFYKLYKKKIEIF